MDEERLRWITRRATLDRWTLTVEFIDTPEGVLASVWATGECKRKRGHLWTHAETVALEHERYTAHDLISHLSLVAAQDRPINNAQLTRGLCGAAWEQPELPF